MLTVGIYAGRAVTGVLFAATALLVIAFADMQFYLLRSAWHFLPRDEFKEFASLLIMGGAIIVAILCLLATWGTNKLERKKEIREGKRLPSGEKIVLHPVTGEDMLEMTGGALVPRFGFPGNVAPQI